MFFAGRHEAAGNQGIANSRRIAVDELSFHGDTTAGGDLFGSAFETAQHAVAACEIDVANIDRETGAAGYAVHGAWKDFADARSRDAVDRASGFRGGFESEGDFRSGEKCVVAVGHQ